ncbi:hypothetical protein BOX15_Mlig000532g4, partial [Macrostomum lignano]
PIKMPLEANRDDAIRQAAEETDRYFNAASAPRLKSNYNNKKCKNNKNKSASRSRPATLASLANRPDEETSLRLAEEYIEATEAAASSPTAAEAECARIYFADWSRRLRVGGFSLLVYGLGSKRHLLRQFKSACLGDQLCAEIDGFHPEAGPKAILTALVEELIGEVTPSSAKSLPDMARLIASTLETVGLTLYIVFHSLDGPQLRTDKAAEAITALVSSPTVRMIASVDHRLCQLLWDRGQLTSMACLWCQLPKPLRPYIEELPASAAYTGRAVESTTAGAGSGAVGIGGEVSVALQLSSLRHLMASLTQNARSLFVMLARRQLERPGEPWPLDEVYTACRDGMLVTSELTLQAHLREFRDHGLVRLKFDGRGQAGDSALVPLPADTLVQFLAAFGDECD